MPDLLPLDHEYVLNNCTKYLARENADRRHDYGQYTDPNDPRGSFCEAWRFPIVDGFRGSPPGGTDDRFNAVTFVWPARRENAPQSVTVLGTFGALYEAIPLAPVMYANGQETGFRAVTVKVPKGELHYYRFIVDGAVVNDPVNPQQATLDNGQTWSRFFTHLCTQPLSFAEWELEILTRLTDHILPFRTEEAQNFFDRFYTYLDKSAKEMQYTHAYRLDQPVGVVNYIDKLVAKEESHHLLDYKICLRLIDNLLNKWRPGVPRNQRSREVYLDLYMAMADTSKELDGWDYMAYNNPRYFLQILRRHTYTGAFAHPKYGGNVGALGWAYLEETCRDASGKSAFDWRRALELPLGRCADYFG
jgi:Gluconate 2-dehydrogenase subunit 3